MLEHVKITAFTHCKKVIQVAMRKVGKEVGIEKSNAKKPKGTILKKKDPERY